MRVEPDTSQVRLLDKSNIAADCLMPTAPLITATDKGLYCAAGDFYIDPWQPVHTAVLTHAHSDHARAGSAHYVAATPSASLLRHRLGADVPLHTQEYGAAFQLGRVLVSLHPAGHILGSAQVRIESDTGVWVITGDYKRVADPTCAPFEPLTCDVLISEATFALPCYRWPTTRNVVQQIFDWWQTNCAAGKASVLFAYALGKAQRVLAELTAFTDTPVYAHGAVLSLVEVYRQTGITMLPTRAVGQEKRSDFAGALIIAPPSAAGSPWLRRFGDIATGFCSGWMQIRGARRRRGYNRGFVLSDHADWPALLTTIAASGAQQVLLTHGYSDPLVRFLNERGTSAAALRTSYGNEADA